MGITKTTLLDTKVRDVRTRIDILGRWVTKVEQRARKPSADHATLNMDLITATKALDGLLEVVNGS
jgi:hypothetical protein